MAVLLRLSVSLSEVKHRNSLQGTESPRYPSVMVMTPAALIADTTGRYKVSCNACAARGAPKLTVLCFLLLVRTINYMVPYMPAMRTCT